MTFNKKKYKLCTSYNNRKGEYIYHWKDGHEEWKNNQCKKSSASFSNPNTNAIIYSYYLITNSEKPTE